MYGDNPVKPKIQLFSSQLFAIPFQLCFGGALGLMGQVDLSCVRVQWTQWNTSPFCTTICTNRHFQCLRKKINNSSSSKTMHLEHHRKRVALHKKPAEKRSPWFTDTQRWCCFTSFGGMAASSSQFHSQNVRIDTTLFTSCDFTAWLSN